MDSKPSILGRLESLVSDNIQIEQHRCVLVRNRNVSCHRCADACVTGCIGIEDGELTLHPERCIGCGTCATLCPTGAITATAPDDGELYDACIEKLMHGGAALTIACGDAVGSLKCPEDSRAVQVRCLGRVDESLLMALQRAGAMSVTLEHGACDSCEYAHGLDCAESVVRTVRALNVAWDLDFSVELSDALAANEHTSDANIPFNPKDQSSPYMSASDDAAPRIAKDAQVVRVGRDGTLPHFVPHRREVLLDVLADVSASDHADVCVPTRLWGSVSIDADVCESCRMCSVFCPTGALSRFAGQDGTFGLEHTPALCVRCRACEDTCPHGALRVSDDVTVRDICMRAAHRHEMPAPPVTKTGAHSAQNCMRALFGNDQVYER